MALDVAYAVAHRSCCLWQGEGRGALEGQRGDDLSNMGLATGSNRGFDDGRVGGCRWHT